MAGDKGLTGATSQDVVHNDHNNQQIPPDLPDGWKYRQRRLFGLNIPWYASPKIQLLMVAFVCFMCPGMFNALGGLGGGGKTDATLADNMVNQIIQHYWLARRLTLTVLDIEYRAVQRLCRLRFLRRYIYQQARCEVDSCVWRRWILSLRDQLVSVCPRRRCGLQSVRWRMAGYLCWPTMDGTRNDHDLLSDRETEGEVLRLVLGYFQHGCCHWQFGTYIPPP